MKKLTLFAIALLASIASFAALNPYAYALSSTLSADETKLTVNYSLNADATYVNIVVLNGETVVKHFSSDKITKGSHTVEISTAELSNADTPKGTNLTWRIEVGGSSVDTPTKQTEEFRFYLPHSLDVDVDPESDYFGRWYVIEATNGGQGKSGYQSNPLGRGLYAFDAALNPILNSNGTRGFTGGMTLGAVAPTNNDGEYFNLYRVATSGGRVFVGRFRSGYAPVLEATDLHSNDYPIVLASAQGRTVGLDVRGRGENLQLALLGTDFTLKEYNLGIAASSASPTQTRDYSSIIVRDNATITYDNEGGIWINQYDPNGEKPTILHLSAEGVDYDNITAGLSHAMGVKMSGIAVSPDGTELAVVSPSKIIIYAISKNLDGKISLATKYTLSTSRDNTAVSYDYAGNLYAANRYSEKINFYAMPYSGMVATPAPSKYAFELHEGAKYTITANVTDETMGSVTGAGTYYEGDTVTLIATANRGHEFVNWSNGATTPTLTFVAEKDLTITANFRKLSYTIKVVSCDEEKGSVNTEGGIYEYGTELNLTATPTTDCRFVRWSNGQTANPLTYIVEEDITLTAIFELLAPAGMVGAPRTWANNLQLTSENSSYTFEFNAVSAGNATLIFIDDKGTETGTIDLGMVEAGTNTKTLTEEEIPGTGKLNWAIKMANKSISSIVEITDNSRGIYNFYLPQGVAVDNNPESATFGNIYVAQPTNGAADGSSTRADNQKRGIFIYNQTLAELNPTSNVGIIPSNVTLGSTTRQAMKRIVIDPTTNNVAFAHNAAPMAVWAVPAENVGGEAKNLIEGMGFTNVNSICFDETGALYALESNGYPAPGSLYKVVDGVIDTLFANYARFGNGDNALVSDGRGGIWIAQNRGQLDTYNQLTHVNAAGEIDFELNSTTPHNFASMNTARGSIAYNPKEHILALSSTVPGGVGANLYSVIYDTETGIPSLTWIAATPAMGDNVDGLAFDYAGDLYGLSAHKERFYKYAVPTANNTCITPAPKSQVLTLGIHTVTITAKNGTIEGLEADGKYEHGATATLTATPDEHYVFVNWKKGEEIISTEATYSFTVTEDVALVANFALDTHVVTVTTENGTIEGLEADGKYEHGATATLTATPNEGYKFVNWTVGENVITENPYSFVVTADITIVANFVVVGPTTNINNVENSTTSIKVIRDNQVLIIRDGKTYNMMGQEVK